jgi:hypothetical protein
VRVRVPDRVTSYAAIGEWAAAQGQAILDCLGGGPSGPQVACEAACAVCGPPTPRRWTRRWPAGPVGSRLSPPA